MDIMKKKQRKSTKEACERYQNLSEEKKLKMKMHLQVIELFSEK